MTIYCIHCGTELPDIATFCFKCGKPVKGDVTTAAQPEPQWEYCEIVCKHSGAFGGKSYFWAKAIGAKGVYEAARSTTPFGIYPSGPDEGGYSPAGTGGKYQSALDEVLAALSAKGWQPVGRDTNYWWKYKFRRLVRNSVDASMISSTAQKGTGVTSLKEEARHIARPKRDHIDISIYRDELIKILEESFKGNHNQSAFLDPNIPEKKLNNAIRTCKVPDGEQILGCIDCTVFGSAKECVLFGTNSLYFHEVLTASGKIPYEDFPNTEFTQKDMNYVNTDNQLQICISGSRVSSEQLTKVLNRLKELFTNIYYPL